MNSRVREYLIDLAAKRKTITYQELSNACNLGLDMQASENDRTEIGKILGAISIFEHEHGRPLISAIVITKGSHYEGDGFYKMAEKLDFGPWRTLRDSAFDVIEINHCFDFWSDSNNYSLFKPIH
jgi:hypothetical protein